MSSSLRLALPALTLVLSAALWGSSWFPFRLLAEAGVDGLWSVALSESIVVLICVLAYRHRLQGMFATRRTALPLICIGLLGGACNTGYVIGAIQGEVVRVTLLLYLSPLWTVFYARWLLHERISVGGLAVIVLSLCGALVMLWPQGKGTVNAVVVSTADLWGLMSGMAYAGYNVLVRRHLEIPTPHKVCASAAGAALVPLAAMPLLDWPAWPATWHGETLLLLIGVGVLLTGVIVLMQYGLERLPAARSSVLLVSELLFATLTAWWWAGEVPGVNALLGGALIAAAALLAARAPVTTDKG